MKYKFIIYVLIIVLGMSLGVSIAHADENTPQTLPPVHTSPTTPTQPESTPDVTTDTTTTSRILAPTDSATPGTNALYARSTVSNDESHRNKSLDLVGAILGVVLMTIGGILRLVMPSNRAFLLQ